MADDIHEQLADAVVSILDGGTYETAFSAEHVQLPLEGVENMGAAVLVEVVTTTIETQAAGRDSDQVDYGLQIGIRKHVANEDAEPKALKRLTQQVIRRLRDRAQREPTLSGGDQVQLVSTALAPMSPDILKEYRVFTSVISVVYRGWE